MPSAMTQITAQPTPLFDKDYYWDFVTFSVEENLFRVPKYRFINDSEIFASAYCLDQDNSLEHVVDPHLSAVKLDVGVDNFRDFLKAMYPKEVQGELHLSKDEWLSILKLSSKWVFKGFRKMAIERLTALNMDPIERVQLGKEYSIKDWLISGYKDIVLRKSPITVEEAKKLDWETAIELYMIRDSGVKKRSSTVNQSKIEAAFAAEITRIEGVQDEYLTIQEKEAIADKQSKEEQEEKAVTEAEEEQLRVESAVVELEKQLAEKLAILEKYRKPSCTEKEANPNLRVSAPMATVGDDDDDD